MHHRRSILLVAACFGALFFACYFSVFFRGHQFGFRDAAHYYYPLYQRVQQEWDAGRIPLWEMEENAGMPILGNPTAAVFYPLKLVYAAFSYPWATRLYVVAHTIVAFVTMLVLMRSWKTSWTGSGLSAMAYAFGSPVLFQSCNIIYLVGASWLPLGVHAVDRWVRRGRRWGLVELVIVLALQTLGGEPQSAYLLGLAAIGYAAGLAWQRVASRRRASMEALGLERWRPSAWIWVVVIASHFILWVLVTLALGCVTPTFRVHKTPPPALPWMNYAPLLVAAAWGLAGLGFLIYWRFYYQRRDGRPMALGIAWLGLAGAAALAIGLTAAQLLPVMEFTQQSLRAAESSPHDIYPFSIEPIRFVGLIWPDVLGVTFDQDTYWGDLLRMPGPPPNVWVPSLYIGVLTLVLAAGAFGLRRGAPWRIWLSVIVVVSVVGSLGQYTSPIWAARALAAGTKSPAFDSLIRHLGPLDPDETSALRQDWYLRDGDGSIYWWLVTFLPGFRQFRYPAKLFTFTTLALAALAGIGWDSLREGARRRIAALTISLLAMTVVALVGVLVGRQTILSTFRAANIRSLYGPFDPTRGYAAIVRSLVHATAALSVGLAAIRLAGNRPRLAGALILVASAADIGLANRHYVLTIPQSTFETTPEILQVIQEAEKARPTPGPYRVHRLPSWSPMRWQFARSPDRGREIVEWERDTLQPKYGIPFGLEYAHVMGVAELYEYEWYFGGFLWTVRDANLARYLGIKENEKVVYFPRRTFDMWNVRYFIIPSWANGWRDAFRGYASMLLETEKIYPAKRKFQGPGGDKAERKWLEERDVQVYRNLREHPRAWVVHSLRRLPAVEEMRPGIERQTTMQEISFEDDPIWSNPTRTVFDFHRVAWVGPDEINALNQYASERSTPTSESVAIRYPNPQVVELDVNLESPGVIVLADVYYPGWKLTIDGASAPIYRINRIMRGAAAGKGPHHLVFTYAPASFKWGLIISAVGFGSLALLGLGCFLRPVAQSLGAR